MSYNEDPFVLRQRLDLWRGLTGESLESFFSFLIFQEDANTIQELVRIPDVKEELLENSTEYLAKAINWNRTPKMLQLLLDLGFEPDFDQTLPIPIGYELVEEFDSEMGTTWDEQEVLDSGKLMFLAIQRSPEKVAALLETGGNPNQVLTTRGKRVHLWDFDQHFNLYNGGIDPEILPMLVDYGARIPEEVLELNDIREEISGRKFENSFDIWEGARHVKEHGWAN